jgi:hypothetical protein
MAISVRDRRGRVKSTYEPEQLYALVRAIATQVKPETPEDISQRAFDRARAATGHEEAPSARAICMRLADRDGKAMKWERVKELALSDTTSIDHVERQREGAGQARYLTGRAVYFSLRLVAGRLQAKTLTPGEYDADRVALIQEEAARKMPRRIISDLLPTVGQIESLYSGENEDDEASWDRALADVGLEPRQQLREQRQQRGRQAESMPLVEAIHLFVEHNDELPSKPRLTEFAQLADIQVETTPRPWGEVLDEAIEYRKGLGLTEPTEHPKSKGGAGDKRKPEVKAPTPGSIPGVAKRRKNTDLKHSRSDCVAAIRRFLDESDGKKTQANYVAFAAKHGLPAASRFEQFGGWTELKREAEQLP